MDILRCESIRFRICANEFGGGQRGKAATIERERHTRRLLTRGEKTQRRWFVGEYTIHSYDALATKHQRRDNKKGRRKTTTYLSVPTRAPNLISPSLKARSQVFFAPHALTLWVEESVQYVRRKAMKEGKGRENGDIPTADSLPPSFPPTLFQRSLRVLHIDRTHTSSPPYPHHPTLFVTLTSSMVLTMLKPFPCCIAILKEVWGNFLIMGEEGEEELIVN
jgi:hypothetical protein